MEEGKLIMSDKVIHSLRVCLIAENIYKVFAKDNI